ncbi:MAG: Unknown protein [uncultured Campylobacterales bacterium]|uniref:RDD domain-containing protein n=1 Tax=uncultured Campylobacterales bacterium TaxID=352960 RepID=A0A6S6SJ06_9BACT|nr:MAG: Unknown protein [uncultured Campylobacterales bacterium]
MKKNLQNYSYAGFWIRVGAAFIDTALLLFITIPLTIYFYGIGAYTGTEINTSFVLGKADILINYILPFIAVILFWHYKAGTPGKMILGLKVVHANTGENLSVGRSIGRYLAYIPAMLPLLLGLIWVGWDKKKQGWHDKLAKTVVIKRNKNTKEVSFE